MICEVACREGNCSNLMHLETSDRYNHSLLLSTKLSFTFLQKSFVVIDGADNSDITDLNVRPHYDFKFQLTSAAYCHKWPTLWIHE